MILTEADASRMFCPQSLASPTLSCCLASRCMAWRWRFQYVSRRFRACDDAFATTEPARPELLPSTWEFCKADVDEPAGWLEPEAEANARRTARSAARTGKNLLAAGHAVDVCRAAENRRVASRTRDHLRAIALVFGVSIFGKLLKTAFDVATVPVAILKDVATLGGSVNDHGSTYIGDKLRQIGQDGEEIRDELDGL